MFEHILAAVDGSSHDTRTLLLLPRSSRSWGRSGACRPRPERPFYRSSRIRPERGGNGLLVAILGPAGCDHRPWSDEQGRAILFSCARRWAVGS